MYFAPIKTQGLPEIDFHWSLDWREHIFGGFRGELKDLTKACCKYKRFKRFKMNLYFEHRLQHEV